MKERGVIHIKSDIGWLDINFKELWEYRDLIWLFTKRNIAVTYKQTILGPLWLILNPLITVLLYVFVFGNIAGLSTDGSPQLPFYLASNALWSYFSQCLSQTSTTFTGNAAIFGKVYFPRLTMPISATLTGCLNLAVQLVMLFVTIIIYTIGGVHIPINTSILLLPVLVIQTALLGLGCGIIISSLTTKYRDLAIVVTFGIQLWMYASPVVYSASQIPEKYYPLYMLNPIAPIMTVWRQACLGAGSIPYFYWGISAITTGIALLLGVLLFNKVEKTFMDTV